MRNRYSEIILYMTLIQKTSEFSYYLQEKHSICSVNKDLKLWQMHI